MGGGAGGEGHHTASNKRRGVVCGAAIPHGRRDRVREGVNRWAWAHSAGRLCRLIGRPRRTVPGVVVQTGIKIEIQIQTLQTKF
jgi:hypothetical protein